MQILMQIIFTILAVAALIGIKQLALPALVTILLAGAVIFFYILVLAGAFAKRQSAPDPTT